MLKLVGIEYSKHINQNVVKLFYKLKLIISINIGVINLENKSINIVVTGDLAINLLQWRTYDNNTRDYSWKSYPQVHSIIKLGEDFLLSKLVALSTKANILSPKIIDQGYKSLVEGIVSTVELGLFPVTKGENVKNKVYRIRNTLDSQGQLQECQNYIML